MFKMSQVALNWLDLNELNIEEFLASRASSYERHGRSTYYQIVGHSVSFFSYRRHIAMELVSEDIYYAEDCDVSYLTLEKKVVPDTILTAISAMRPNVNELIQLPPSLKFFHGAKIIGAEQRRDDLRLYLESNWKILRIKHPKRATRICNKNVCQMF